MAYLKQSFVPSVLALMLLLATAAGCGSDSEPTASPVGTAAETPAISPTAASTEAEPPTDRETPGPTGPAAEEGSPAPTATPSPAMQPATATPVAAPSPSAVLQPTATPFLIRVSESSAERETSPSVSAADLAALTMGNAAFAFDLYRSVAETEGNLFFSPHSISTALAMAYAGASGDTERQMSETLRFGLPQDDLHPAFNALDLSLVAREPIDEQEGFRLNIANAIWGQEDYGFLPEFLDTLAVNYGDGVRPVDFQGDPEGSRARINDWVAETTEERITELIPRDAIDRFTRMVLANAIYFKAGWQHPFKKEATSPGAFHLLDGSEREVPMMRQQASLRYAKGDGYQAVELPYKGGDVAMTVLLPDAGKFRDFEESLS